MTTQRFISAIALVFVSALVFNPVRADHQGRASSGRASTTEARRAGFLEMFARSYFPGRSGQIMLVPREGEILTRADADVAFMHGSPWAYDSAIPLFLVGSQIVPGVRQTPARQQDLAVTLAAALGVSMPPTATGRVLPVLRPNATKPKAIFLVVLDGMRIDYFDKHAAAIPTLSGLRKRSAWFSNARINYLPTNTAAGHTTIATGTDPRIHGIIGNNLFDRVQHRRHDMYEGWNPRDLTALTLADVWQLENGGKAVVIAQGSSLPSSTALSGHGACQVGGARTVHAGYDETTGTWKSNAECFTLLPELAQITARSLLPADGLWMGNKVDTPSNVRRSALFPRFEADAFIRMIETQPIGNDDVADLLLLNLKGADYVGHKYGPESAELAATLQEIDRQFARILAAVEAKVGTDYLLAVTADHGMPSEPTGGRSRHFAADVATLLNVRFDPEQKALVPYYEPENSQMFVDLDRLSALKLTLDDLAAFLRQQPFLDSVFTEGEVRRAAAALK
jgi:hypothetical protein